jgi:hypothetical protein
MLPPGCVEYARRVGPFLHFNFLRVLGVELVGDYQTADEATRAALHAEAVAAEAATRRPDWIDPSAPVPGPTRLAASSGLGPGAERLRAGLEHDMQLNPTTYVAPPQTLLLVCPSSRRRPQPATPTTRADAALAALYVALKLEFKQAAPAIVASASLVPARDCPAEVQGAWKTLDFTRQVVAWVVYHGVDAHASEAVTIPRAVACSSDALGALWDAASEVNKLPATFPVGREPTLRHGAGGMDSHGHEDTSTMTSYTRHRRRPSPSGRRNGRSVPDEQFHYYRRPHEADRVPDDISQLKTENELEYRRWMLARAAARERKRSPTLHRDSGSERSPWRKYAGTSIEGPRGAPSSHSDDAAKLLRTRPPRWAAPASGTHYSPRSPLPPSDLSGASSPHADAGNVKQFTPTEASTRPHSSFDRRRIATTETVGSDADIAEHAETLASPNVVANHRGASRDNAIIARGRIERACDRLQTLSTGQPHHVVDALLDTDTDPDPDEANWSTGAGGFDAVLQRMAVAANDMASAVMDLQAEAAALTQYVTQAEDAARRGIVARKVLQDAYARGGDLRDRVKTATARMLNLHYLVYSMTPNSSTEATTTTQGARGGYPIDNDDSQQLFLQAAKGGSWWHES